MEEKSTEEVLDERRQEMGQPNAMHDTQFIFVQGQLNLG